MEARGDVRVIIVVRANEAIKTVGALRAIKNVELSEL